ncbi:hypothetical protein KRR26_05560 [Corallococcus sp. M34]|uniref:hypothetical protein n=1 Tax=Citreicoccus inhibens TaxID=2849499 RepID=UPI001C24412C|nr:hypothetical protein [Citreicoccus inhibens]MBU8895059.1 hypothetical protein [Citreicoccus inhibens]
MPQPPRISALLPVEVELQKERASGLRRTGDKVEKALESLAQAEQALRASTGAAREACLVRYRERYQEAERQRWNLMVQREAVGMRNHRDLDVVYPMPPKWRG